MQGVSVILCCYNSEKLIDKTLRQLANQRVSPEIPWEIILVNNASTDNTSKIAFESWTKYRSNVPFKIIDEPVAGLSSARKRGIAESKYEFMIFCDDDNRLGINYVETVFNVMTQNQYVGALGGQTEDDCEVNPPKWFADWKNWSYAIGRQGDISGDITWTRGFVWGAGMAIRKQAWESIIKLGFRSLLSDRKGKELTAGGDSEICYAMRLAGWQIWFEPKLKLIHYMPSVRLDWKYLRKLWRGFGASTVALDVYSGYNEKEIEHFDKLLKNKNTKSYRDLIKTDLRKLRSFGYNKINSFSESHAGDPDLLMIEHTLGRLNEHFKNFKSYNSKVRFIRKNARKKEYKLLKAAGSEKHFRFPQYKKKNDKRGISVVINFYGGSYKHLVDCIESLCRQKVHENFPWEIIIYTNFIIDEVKKIIYDMLFEFKCKAKLKIIDRQLSSTLFGGIDLSFVRYDNVLFCNENVRLDKNYVRKAYRILSSNKNAGAIGGEIQPLPQVNPPKWFNQFKEIYGIENRGIKEINLTWSDSYLKSTGLIIRKKLLAEFIERKEKILIDINDINTFTEEIEINNYIRLNGYEVYYEPELKLRKFIPVKNLNWEYIRKLFNDKGKAEILTEPYGKILKKNSLIFENPRGDDSWIYRLNKIIAELSSFHYKKIFSGKKDYEGDEEIVKIEQLKGRLSELLLLKRKFNKGISKAEELTNRKKFLDLRLSENRYFEKLRLENKPGRKKGVSIVICCYNSSKLLPDTLRYIFNQRVKAGIPWEVIIVDNASTDKTSEVAQKIRNSYRKNIPFRVVKENKLGLTAAREKGFETAKYEYIVLCDDDNWLEKNFVNKVFEVMSGNDEIGVLGGRSKGVYEDEPDKWFNEWKNSFAIGNQNEAEGDITWSRGYVWGAAMVVRKKAWDELKSKGFKSILTDRKGNQLSAGGDTEICYALRNEGWKIFYNPELKFKHYLPSGRLKWEYLQKLFAGFGTASSGLDHYRKTSRQIKEKPESLRKEIHKSLSTLRKIGYRKLLNGYKKGTGDPDIPMIEYSAGRLESLIKSTGSYNKGIRQLKRIAYKRDLRNLKKVFRKFNKKSPAYISDKKPDGVSVIVCTYNGADRLPETMMHLAKQKVSSEIPWEVILIDNASTDNSKEAARKEWAKHNCSAPLRIVDQPIPGKQLALEKGYEVAKYEYWITCDDDNWLEENFVQLVHEIMNKDETIGVLGGPNEAVCEVEPPEWFKWFQKDYAAGEQGDIYTTEVAYGDITWKRGFVWGAGMVVRRTAWNKLIADGFNSSMSCRKGTELTSGGDSEACYALVLAGWKVWYDERLKLKHYMSAGRLDWNYLIRLFSGFGVASVGLEPYEKAIKLGVTGVDENEINKQDWKFEFKKTLKKLREYGIKKILSLRFSQNGNTEIPMLEFYISRLRELLRVRKEYDKNFEEIKNSSWKKPYSQLRAQHKKFLDSENDFRYGWPWSDENIAAFNMNGTPLPKISILSPSFNSEGTIEKAILSVLKQGYPNFEHIIADGGSTDGTLEIIKKYPHLKLIPGPDKGQSDAMNKAFDMSTGDIVVYLNVDDYFQRGAFSKVITTFLKNPSSDIVVGNLFFEYVNHTFIRKPESEYKKIMLPFLFLFPINPVSYFYKRDVQKNVGPFPLDNHYTMDYWFLLKAFQNHSAVKIEDYLGTFCMNGFNKTSNSDNAKNVHHRVLYHCWHYDRKNLLFYLYTYYKFHYIEKEGTPVRKFVKGFKKNSQIFFAILSLKNNKYYSQKAYGIGRFRYFEQKRFKAMWLIAVSYLIYPKAITKRSRYDILLPVFIGKNFTEKFLTAYRFFAYPPGMPLSQKLNYYGNEFKNKGKGFKGNSLLALTYILAPSYFFNNQNAKPPKDKVKVKTTEALPKQQQQHLKNFYEYFKYKRFKDNSYRHFVTAQEYHFMHKRMQALAKLTASVFAYPPSAFNSSRSTLFVKLILGDSLYERVKVWRNFFIYPKGMPLHHKLNYYGNDFKNNKKSFRGSILILLSYILSPSGYFKSKKEKPEKFINPAKEIKPEIISSPNKFTQYFKYRKYKSNSEKYFEMASEKYYFHKNFQAMGLLFKSFLLYPPSAFRASRINLFIRSVIGDSTFEKLNIINNFFKYPEGMPLSHKLNYYGRNFKSEGKNLKGNLILALAFPLSPSKYFSMKGSGKKFSFGWILKSAKSKVRIFGGKVKYRLKLIYYFFRYKQYKAKSKKFYSLSQENIIANKRFNAFTYLTLSLILYPKSVTNKNKLSLLLNSVFGNSVIHKLKKINLR